MILYVVTNSEIHYLTACMVLYNHFLEKFLLPTGDFLLGQGFMRNLQRLRREVLLNECQINELQKKRLYDILHYSVKNSCYYKSLNIKHNNDPYFWIKQFPILDKKKIREQQANLLALPQRNLLRQFSSGSSGLQSIVYWTKQEQSVHRATQILWWEWAGYNLGMPMIQTGITPNRGFVKAVKDKLLRTYYFPAFVPTQENFMKALQWASGKKEVFLGGYASSLHVLSGLATKLDMDVKLSGAVSWGDKLFDHYRKSIDDTFSTTVKETYGSAEGLMIAAQKDLPYMYIMTPNVYLEILDDHGNDVPDGEMGHVVVTSLVAKGMPLIRYKIGDLAIKLPKIEYPDKREFALPLLKKVVGRDTDLVKTESGKIMVVHTFTGIFEHYPEIEQFCVIQKSFSGIEIQYIPSAGFNHAILEKIRKRILQYLSEPFFDIEFKAVTSIPPTPSGKPQIIISKINEC